MTLNNKIRIGFCVALLTLAALISISAPLAYGDGSDPMPLCRQRVCK